MLDFIINMNRAGRKIFVLFSCAVWSSIGAAADAIDFTSDVQPILKEYCTDCHDASEQNGGLNLDDRATVFSQANSGSRALVAGKANESELFKRITSTSEDDQMPPDGDRLPAEQIELIRNWILEGAAWPRSNRPTNAVTSDATQITSSHWSFQPVQSPEPPSVRDEQWPRNAIDHFIQHQRESTSLAVAPGASPTVLIRRASFGLTGLPPSPQEVNDFIQAVEKQGVDTAFSALVDDLLSRPTYGQRWGRHWMDWVRYADTAGDNSDFPIPQAYLYRNYIIESLNDDVRYDQFLIEQLAGDLLPAESQEQRNRQNIATGYLAMARRFGSLVETYPWHLTIEDTIDNVGRTMMGLTLSCARCHDHKFDPISTRDYYGLYGIFASTNYPFPGIELFQTQHDLVPLIPETDAKRALEPYQAKTDKLERKLDRLLEACRRRELENAEKQSGASLAEQRRMKDELDDMLLDARKAGQELAKHLKQIPSMPVAYAVQEGDPQNARIQLKGEPDRPGAEVRRKFPDILGAQELPEPIAKSGSGRRELARWITDPSNPLTARVIVNRVWQRHFGVGLVPSTSDFGLRGEHPTHPELLDWLATEFVRSGWSIKQLHRTMMTSRTYQLSSQNLEENLSSDPANRYYWKFNRQRLDAESIRDTLLSIAGTLDATPQLESYPIPPHKDWEYTQHHPFKDDYGSNKRSVYMMTKRLTAKSYYQTFDGPDPNVCTSDRDQSVTPLQALYFVNDGFLHEQAEQLAQLLLEESVGDYQRAARVFMIVLCRQPTDDEQELMASHITAVRRKTNDELATWSSLTRSLLRLNEFLYVD